MDKLEIKQGPLIQQTQYFKPVEIDLITPERTRKHYRISIWRQI
jgi:hypothetical protein